jgi:hypothetical protein
MFVELRLTPSCSSQEGLVTFTMFRGMRLYFDFVGESAQARKRYCRDHGAELAYLVTSTTTMVVVNAHNSDNDFLMEKAAAHNVPVVTDLVSFLFLVFLFSSLTVVVSGWLPASKPTVLLTAPLIAYNDPRMHLRGTMAPQMIWVYWCCQML